MNKSISLFLSISNQSVGILGFGKISLYVESGTVWVVPAARWAGRKYRRLALPSGSASKHGPLMAPAISRMAWLRGGSVWKLRASCVIT